MLLLRRGRTNRPHGLPGNGHRPERRRWTVSGPCSLVDRRPSIHDDATDRRLGWPDRRMELHDESLHRVAVRAARAARDLHRRAHGCGRGPRRGRARRLPRTPGRGPCEPRGSLHDERIPHERRWHRCRAIHRVRVSGLRPGDDGLERGLAVPGRSDPPSRRRRSVGIHPHPVLRPPRLRGRQRDAGSDRHDPASSARLLSGDVVRTTSAYRAADFEDTVELLRYTGRFEELTPDRNGDGTYDALVIRAEVEVFATASFDLSGLLAAAGGSPDIAKSFSQVWLQEGLRWAEVSFAGPDIRLRGIDGPYLATLSITPGARGIDPTTTYTTLAYHATDFDATATVPAQP